ncbi:MAG: hypothetical protein GQE15_40950 [Archangiaceae bacterium]|nr:hypothetical protein [Archangiaceae bacterium]
MTSIRPNVQVRHGAHTERHTEYEPRPAGRNGSRAVRADGFERTTTEPQRPTSSTSSLDAAFNFTIDVGGQKIQGNLLELILAAVLEKLLGSMDGQQPKIGEQVTGDGRQYVVEPGDASPRPDSTSSTTPSTGSTPETWPSWPGSGTAGTSGPTGTPTTTGTSPATATGRAEIPADLCSADGGANIRSAADIDRLPIWQSMHPNAVSFYKNKIREQLESEQPSTMGISGLVIHIGGNDGVTTTPGATPQGLDRLPIWTNEWDATTTAAWKQRMSVDHTPVEGQLAALEKFRAFQQELTGDAPRSFNTGYQSGYVQNMFISGAIYNPRFYELGREQKQFITSEYQRLLGRPPSRNELQKWTYLSANMSVNESEFTKLKTKFATITPGELTASVPERFTDREIADGVRAYLQANPNATEAQIRQVATSQYGVSSNQLDRVKRDYFPSTSATPAPRTYTDREVADGVRAYIAANPNATEAQIRQVATSQYGVSSAQLDRVKRDFFPATPAPTTTTPAPRTYADREVADGVRAYIAANPGATEAQIRQVATSQYGVSSAQLDRVKRDYFPSTPAPVTQPTTTQPTTTTPSSPAYTDAQVADGVRAYIAANPGATEAQIRQVAMSQYGVSSAQLDRVKRDYFS